MVGSSELFTQAKEAQKDAEDLCAQIKGLRMTPDGIREARLEELHKRRRNAAERYYDAIDELDRRKFLKLPE